MVERNIFPLPEVSAELEKMVEARLHADLTSSPFIDRILALQKKLTGTRAVPVYLLLDPATEKVLARRNGASFDPDVFLEFFRSARPDD